MQVFIVMRRTDIPDGVLQQVDLKPNTSNRNYIYTPGEGQTGYIRNIQALSIASRVAAGPPVSATADLTGLAAYLIGNIDTTAAPGSAPFTGAQADTAATGIAAIAQAGTALTLAAVNAVLAGVVAGTTLTAGGSTGDLGDLLSALAGREYLIPSGTAISNGGGFFAGQVGDFVTGTYRRLRDNDGFIVSNTYGNLSKMKSANFTYADVTGAAVTVYDVTGAVL
jgi:hypothetical protein